MKLDKSIVFAFILLVVCASLYRVWDGRPWGFAPQIAMAVFAGAVIKDKRWAIVLPLLSMFISDSLYHLLYLNGLSIIPGFYYEGQILNYILFGSLAVFGFLIKKINFKSILLASLAAPTVYFLISNFLVWIGGGGYFRPKTWEGLLMSFNDGLPFYRGSLFATLVFSTIFFGSYFLLRKYTVESEPQLV